MRAALALVAAIMLGCSAPDTRPVGDAGDPVDAGADVAEDTSSTDDTCKGNPVGFLCWGSADEAIHGECGEFGTCLITDWTCVHGAPGIACSGGVCVAPVEEQTAGTCCRKGCVDATGHCIITLTSWHGGKPCPN